MKKKCVLGIIFSTPKNKEDELYLQCFEQKFNGLIYIPTYGSMQGESKSLYGMTTHFLNNITFALILSIPK